MPSWFKIATWFLLFSLATFSFKKPTFFWQNTNINDVALLLSFICLTIAYYKKQVIYVLPRKIWISFLFGFGSIVFATSISIFFRHIFAPDAPREFMRIIACVIIFSEVYLISTQDTSFPQKALFALIIPSFLLPFIFYLPHHTLSFFLDESQTRFNGFLLDPNYYASIQILPSMLLLWFASVRKSMVSVFYYFLYAFSVGSILWSGSRGGILGLVGCIGILIFFFIWKEVPKKAVFLSLCLLCVTFLSYLILPTYAHSNINTRILGLKVGQTGLYQQFSAQQGRMPIWKNAFKKTVINPLGYGAGYSNAVDIQGDNNDHYRVAHNTILQIFLTGGVILFFLFCIGVYYLTKNTFAIAARISEVHYLYAALFGIGIAGIFLDSLWSRWVWVIAALIVVLTKKKDYDTITNN